ncbi:MAG: M1 family metallopeptidase [Flavobacteriales bacterium]
MMKNQCLYLVATAIAYLSTPALSLSQVDVRTYIDDPERTQRSHNVDMQHLKLDVSFNPAEGMVMGKETLTFTTLQKNVDSLFLDGPGIEVSLSKLDGKKVRVVTLPEGLVFYFDKLKWQSAHELYLEYTAHPEKGIYFIGWGRDDLPKDNPDHLIRKQIWTQGQGIDNRHWFPSYDATNDKLTTETIIHFNSQYRVISNGKLVEKKENKDGTTAWHFKMSKPHVPYLVMIAIGDYKVKKALSKSGVTVNMWYYPEWENRVNATYKGSAKMIDFFERETGFAYPWSSYSIIPVQNFLYGAMENTTATIYGDFYHVDQRQYLDKNFVSVNAHELAHQWFGDCVTAKSRAHNWLQESFATHYNMMWEKEAFGQDHLEWKRRQATTSALKASEKDLLPIVHSKAGTVRIYPKGGTVLYMLKYVVGKDEFNRAIQYYLNKHQYGNVDTEDLLEAFEETTGKSLDWFWQEWLYHGGEPHYRVSFRDIRLGNGGLRISQFSVDQVYKRNDVVGLFRMPFVFRIVYKDGSKKDKTAWIEEVHEEVNIPNKDNKEIAYVLFDVGSVVIKAVDFDKPFEMLQAQALKAEHMIDRFDALVALRKFDLAQKRATLLNAWKKETFHATRSEIIRQLMPDTDPASRAVIISALADGPTKTKLTLLGITDSIPADILPHYEQLLSDSSYSVVAVALKLLINENPGKFQDYMERTKDIIGALGSNVVIAWLEMGYLRTSKKEYVDRLVAYTGNAYEFRTRVNAAQALQRLDYFDVQLMRNLFDAVCHFNRRLSNPCASVLRYFHKQDKHRKMIDNYYREGRWSQGQVKKLAAFFEKNTGR